MTRCRPYGFCRNIPCSRYSSATGSHHKIARSGEITMAAVRILIADDHAIIRRGLRALLAHDPDFEIVAEAVDGRGGGEIAQRLQPHVAVLDVAMPVLNGIEAARQISAHVRNVQVVLLTVHSEECYLLSALKAGVRGYVLKSSAESETVEAVGAVSK